MIKPIANSFAVTALLCCVSLVTAQDETRKEWQYETPAGIRRIADQGDGKWLLHFPNGATVGFKELQRTSEYVELKNQRNENVQRLFRDHGQSQKAGQGPFRKFTEGQWVIQPPSAKNRQNDYKVRVIYFVPTDRRPLPEYQTRIRHVLNLANQILTLDLRQKGYKTEGPQFQLAEDGGIKVELLQGEKTAREYNHLPVEKAAEHPEAIFAEVDRRVGDPDNNLTFIFAETYEDGPSRRFWPGHVAVAAARPPSGGIAVFSAWILRDEFSAASPSQYNKLFFDETLVIGRKAIGHKGPISPRSEFMEDGVGGALHELAHTFGLTHHGRGAAGRTNVMGQGFRSLRWNVGLQRNTRLKASFSKENALMLMTSRYLNSEIDRSDNTRPKAEVSIKQVGLNLQVDVNATDDKNLSLLTVVEVTKNDGRQLVATRQLSGKQDSVKLRITPKDVSSRNPTLQFILIDAGGNHRKISRSL